MNEAGWKHLRCTSCGKVVSTPVPASTIVRAVIECPECIETNYPEDGRT